jgi:hypothetical protein
MPRLSKRKRHLASISHAGAMATNSKRWHSEPQLPVPSMEPPPSPLILMGETPPELSMEEPLSSPALPMEESSPALSMEEPPPTLSMESLLVEGLEESQPFFSEYEDEEDSQLEVDESGDSDISSDDDEVL